ncbi:hypothetical protein SRABI70_04736 [Pseudomonas sp. Bi70]|nr:hypothetical protein SRABI70_04736 [Pseudomonas sp. Bi70]
MLGIGGYRPRRTKTIELDTLRLGAKANGLFQRHRVELLAHFDQGMQGGVEDLHAEVGDRVVLVDRELAEAGAGGQALRQLELEILKTTAADGAAEAHDGRLADAHQVREFGHGAVHDRRRIEKHMIGHLEFRLAQEVT